MYENELRIAELAAKQAGDYLKNTKEVLTEKSIGRDIKLSNDKESEKIIINALKHTNYSILSEELGFVDKKTSYLWIIDPIDGSMNYSRNLRDLSCISIALYQDNHPLFGVVYRYYNDELFVGTVDGDAFCNGEKITGSQIDRIDNAVLGTGFTVRRNYSIDSIQNCIKMIQKFKKVRMIGSAALMCVFVACGRLDAYIEEDVMIWDVAASLTILESAGGKYELIHKDGYVYDCICFANETLYNDYCKWIKYYN